MRVLQQNKAIYSQSLVFEKNGLVANGAEQLFCAGNVFNNQSINGFFVNIELKYSNVTAYKVYSVR